nr:hypothetical protein [uncultured Psychroserpens sp.]
MFKSIIRLDNYLCPLMQFFKKNIFGFLAIVVGLYLLTHTIININEILEFKEFENIGEYSAVKKSIQPNLGSGVLKTSLVFLLFLIIPVILSIVHKRRKANNKIMYIALVIVLANFLVFPYLLTLLYNSII